MGRHTGKSINLYVKHGNQRKAVAAYSTNKVEEPDFSRGGANGARFASVINILNGMVRRFNVERRSRQAYRAEQQKLEAKKFENDKARKAARVERAKARRAAAAKAPAVVAKAARRAAAVAARRAALARAAAQAARALAERR